MQDREDMNQNHLSSVPDSKKDLPSNQNYEVVMLAYLLRRKEKRIYFHDLDDKDFYAQECKDCFNLLKGMFDHDEDWDSLFLYEEDYGIDASLIQCMYVTTFSFMARDIYQELKKFRLLREMIYLGHDLSRLDNNDKDRIDTVYEDFKERYENLITMKAPTFKNTEDFDENKIVNHYGLVPYQKDHMPDLRYNEGNMIIIGGYTGSGKTTMMLNMMASLKGENVLCFSFEMGFEEIYRSMLRFHESKNDFSHVLCDDKNFNLEKITSNIRKAYYQKGCRVFFIDYLQQIRTNKKFNLRHLEIGYISGTLKQVALSLGCCIVCLAQLNRKSEERTLPILSDLRESGSIEQDADIVILLGTYDQTPNRLNFIVAKNRRGPIWSKPLEFNKERGTIHDIFREDETFSQMDERPVKW